MTQSEIKQLINKTVSLIAISPEGIKEANIRCTKFLTAMAIIANYKLSLEVKKAKLITVSEALYADAIQAVSGKNVTEKKINVAKDVNFTTSREQLEELNAELEWLKTYQKIFENAHLVYRNQAKEQM